MTRIEKGKDTLVVTQGTWLFTGMGLALLAIFALCLAFLLFRPRKAGDGLRALPGIVPTGLAGAYLAAFPISRKLTVQRGSVMIEERRLLGVKRRTETTPTEVAVTVGAYSGWAELRFANAAPMKFLSSMKTWTWQKDVPRINGLASEVAAFLQIVLR